MARIYVSIGSNIDREHNIRSSVTLLRDYYGALIMSTIYESPAVGFSGDPFYNLVVGFDSDDNVENIARNLHAIEQQHGRRRSDARFSPRTLDLDLLLYDDLVCQGENFTLPRPEIMEYPFVLRPLAEIAGPARHPISGERYRDLWRRFANRTPALTAVTLVWNLDTQNSSSTKHIHHQ